MKLIELQKKLEADFGDQEAAVKSITESGYTILGIGVSRIGVAIDEKTIAKLAWRESGLVDNLLESKLTDYIKENDPRITPQQISLNKELRLADMIVPVQQYYDGSITMPRCLPVNYQQTDVAHRQIVQALSKFGITDSAVNLGLLEGRLVCFDYCYISDKLYRQLN